MTALAASWAEGTTEQAILPRVDDLSVLGGMWIFSGALSEPPPGAGWFLGT